jgi:cell division protease FtsH
MLNPSDIIQSINNKQIEKPNTWSYNEFINHLNTIESGIIVDNQKLGLFYDKSDSMIHVYKYLDSNLDNILNLIIKKGIDFQVYNVPLPESFKVPVVIQTIGTYIIFSVIFGLVVKIIGEMSMNPMNALSKKQELVEEGQIETRFVDVAGLDEAKEELEEIVDYLKNPLKYTFVGAKIPKGVLLEGPPGTGKTLLARAVAGEAGVNFISASGSEFIEMFVGVGAQRVRNIFEKARENKPCVIFIDEIDAVGGKRGYGFNSGGNDEREQTLNQILTNMDGFDKSDGIIVLAATNRADTLDSALKRSGRFDRKVQVPLPDLLGRKEIAKVHFKNKPNVDIDYDKIATLTSGFSGADLATLANEAAILSIRNNKTQIDNCLVNQAFEKMTIGIPKKYDIRSYETKKLVAVHEVGHSMMILYFSDYFKLQKVTMNANTAGAEGYTLFTPNNYYNEYQTKGFYLAQLIVSLGGRAGEIVYFKNNSKTNYEMFNNFEDIDITTGASSDIKQANKIAQIYIELFENYIVSDNSPSSMKKFNDYRISELIKDSLDMSVNIIENDIEYFYFFVEKLLKEKTINFN